MPQYFHKLENALKRANEFIDVGKKLEALEILCDVLRSRKHRTWQKYHDDIMLKYLELCVELRKSYVAKEGIYQYKIICQQTQIKSFEDVVRKYLDMAEAKAETARVEAQAATLDVDDLDNLQTPENILLSAVSSEVSQDRTDRVVLLPWVKFLWESYRQCLDLLRNYGRTEKLYHDIAKKAFEFCIKFNRKTEFRKLCDNLHAHLDGLKKQLQFPMQHHANQTHVNLSNPESQALHLGTRLLQLESAITMELWQEAYKATDDIKRFGLMNLQKKPLKPQVMAGYYHKLALVFQKANCPIFHAAALLRYFVLNKELKKNIKEEELTRLASKVVAATLSMPIPPTRPEIDKLVDTEENVIENHHRNLASLLGLSTVVPTRSSLIRDLKRMNVLTFALPELQQLYQWLEVDFDPLLLCKRVEGVVTVMEKSDDLKQYVSALKEVTIVRLLKEVAQVYSSMQMSRLLELCPYIDPVSLENIVVNSARRNDIQIRIDHRKQCLNFGGIFMAQSDEVIEGPFLQSMPSSQMRQQLVNVYSVLQKARAIIEKDKVKTQREQIKRSIMNMYERNKENEHKQLLERQQFIEVRKDLLEENALKKEEMERTKQEEIQRRLREEERKKMQQEMEEREKLRIAQESEELRKKMALDVIETLKQTEAGQKMLETLDENELLDLKLDDIRLKQWEQLEKERKEQQEKQLKLEKKIDHMERAKRLEEIPLLEKQYKKEKELDKELFEEMEKQRIADLVAERELALKHRDRLLRMNNDASAFMQRVRQHHAQDFQKRHDVWKQRLDELKAERLRARAQERKEKRRMEYLKKKKEQEEAQREAEKRAKFEAEKKTREEERRRLDEAARKQREKEEEIERKLREKEDAERERMRRDQEDTQQMIRPQARPSDTEPWRGGQRGPPIERNNPPRSIPPVSVSARDENEDTGSWRKGDRSIPNNPSSQEPSQGKYVPKFMQENRQGMNRGQDEERKIDAPRKIIPPRESDEPWTRGGQRDMGPPSHGGHQQPYRPPNRDGPPRHEEDRRPRHDEDRRPRQDEDRRPRHEDDQRVWRGGQQQQPSHPSASRGGFDRGSKADDQGSWRKKEGPPSSDPPRTGGRFDSLKPSRGDDRRQEQPRLEEQAGEDGWTHVNKKR